MARGVEEFRSLGVKDESFKGIKEAVSYLRLLCERAVEMILRIEKGMS